MSDMDKIHELREKLRRERTGTITDPTTNEQPANNHPTISSTSGDIERYVPELPTTNGTSVQSSQGSVKRANSAGKGTGGTQGRTDDQLRGIASINFGVGRTDRRSSQDHGKGRTDGSNVSSSARKSKRGVGNLETEEPVPERYFDIPEETRKLLDRSPLSDTTPATKSVVSKIEEPRKRGRKPAPGIISVLPTIKQSVEKTLHQEERTTERAVVTGGSKTLSKQEVSILEDPLIAALQTEFELLDKALYMYTKDVNPLNQPIWGDMSDEHVGTLARGLLRVGQKSPTAATIARTAINADSYIATAMLIAPRFQKSVVLVQQEREYKRREKGEVDEDIPRRTWLRRKSRNAE